MVGGLLDVLALDTACLQAGVDSKGDVVWYTLLQTRDLNDAETTEGSTDDIRGKAEDWSLWLRMTSSTVGGILTALTDLTDAWVFVIEASNKHRRLAARIHLVVDSADFEDSSGSWSYLHINKARAVLDQHARTEGAVDGEVDLGGTRVSVREIETAWAEVSDCYEIVGEKSVMRYEEY